MKRGRKSKYIIEKMMQKEWKVAVYIRLSVQDGDKAESNSVANQKELLNMFLNQKEELNIYDYYIDDGFSGTTFERPEFKRMMEDIKKGVVNTIIVKDLSRFGRNYIEMGEKINTFLKDNIRFISVCENIDSYLNRASIEDIIFPLKNIMNEVYCKDISKKITTALSIMKKEGKFIGSQAPFGYQKDKNNKHHLVIDNAAASVVRKIFDLCESGLGNTLIAKELNEKCILTPSEYNYKVLKNISTGKKVSNKWSASIVSKLLDNRVYCGDIVQNKSRGISYKVHKRIPNNETDYIIVENTHEPIIEKERYFRIQEMRKNRKFNWNKRVEDISVFDGIVICSNCGKPMNIAIREKNEITDIEVKKYILECSECNKDNSYQIKAEKLKTCIFRSIKYHIDLLNGVENAKNNISSNKNYADHVKANIENLKAELEDLENERTEYFKRFREFEIMEEEYFSFIKDNVLKEEKIKMMIQEEKLKIRDARQEYKSIIENVWIDTLLKYKNQKKLTKEMLEDLIEKIYIFKDGRKIRIKFKYEDAYKVAMDYLKIVRRGGNIDA